MWHLGSPLVDLSPPLQGKGSSAAFQEEYCSSLPCAGHWEGPAGHGNVCTLQMLVLLGVFFFCEQSLFQPALCVLCPFWSFWRGAWWAMVCGTLFLEVGVPMTSAVPTVGIFTWEWSLVLPAWPKHHSLYELEHGAKSLGTTVAIWPLFSNHSWSEAHSQVQEVGKSECENADGSLSCL